MPCKKFVAYPLETDEGNAVSYNMVSALLGRVHLSGQLAGLHAEQFRLVQDAIAVYKAIRAALPTGVPFWPLGLPGFTSQWLCLGLHTQQSIYLAIWRQQSVEDACVLPLRGIDGFSVQVDCLYPTGEEGAWSWDANHQELSVHLPQPYSARLFRLLTTPEIG